MYSTESTILRRAEVCRRLAQVRIQPYDTTIIRMVQSSSVAIEACASRHETFVMSYAAPLPTARNASVEPSSATEITRSVDSLELQGVG